MSRGRTRPGWYDPEDERITRMAWSRLIEPGDEEGWDFVERHGPGPALRRVVEDGVADPEVRPRWLVRLDHTDPGRDLAVMHSLGGVVLIPGDAQWPERLDDLQGARPLCLWARGPLPPADACRRSIAVVGARAATWYGRDLSAGIALGCAEAGLTVVSGGAYGIDAAAHRATLAGGGHTVAVLACGVDRSYPRGHDRLLAEIAERHGVLSEVPPGAAPTRWRFLQRNRLIAAMTAATVVVEAAWRSGALNTAGHARELGRPVGACPGPVSSATSAGCHRLLRQGATCITDAAEAVELASAIGEVWPDPPPVPAADHDGLDAVHWRTLDAVPVRRPASLDAIARTAGLEPQVVRRALGRLVSGDLVQVRDGWFRRAPRATASRASP